MMLTNLILLAGAAASGLAAQAPKVEWTTPDLLFAGRDFAVHVTITAPKEGVSLPSWMMEAAAFTLNGKPLGERREGVHVALAPNAKISIDVDLGGLIGSATGFDGQDFKLGYGQGSLGVEEKEVRFMQAAEQRAL